MKGPLCHRRPSFPAVLGAAALLFLGAAWSGTALAQGPGNAGGFEIDGNLPCSNVGTTGITPGEDWFANPPSACVGVILGSPACSPNPARLPALFERDPHWAASAVDLSTFTGMSNKNNDNISAGVKPWSWGSGSGPQKNDITEVYAHSRTDSEGNLWLIIGAATRATNGDSHIDFEFNRAGITRTGTTSGLLIGNGPSNGRTIGDLIVSVDYTIGGGNPIPSVRRWNGVEYLEIALPAGAAFTATNFVNIAAPCGATAPNGSAASEYIPLQFAEAALNLNLVGITPSELCNVNSTLIVKTRSSQSFTAELKDWGLYPFPIVLPPTCSIDGPDQIQCPLGTATYSGPPGMASYSWTMLSGDCTFVGPTNAQSVTVRGGPGCGTCVIKLTITDRNGCSSECQKTIQIVDTVAPVITCAGNKTISCTQAVSFDPPSAIDNCDPSPGIEIVSTITTPGRCPQERSVTRTWRATDACGNQSTCSQTVFVVDNVPPVITCVANKTISCTQAVSFDPPSATDNCDPSPTIEIVSTLETPGRCPQERSVTRTWRAIDACGNVSASCSQTVFVVDDVPPAIVCGGDITGVCGQPVTFAPTATDNCDGDVTVTCDPPSGTIFPSGETTVTCTAVDDCGNRATCTFKVRVTCPEGCTPGFWQGGFGSTLWNTVADPDWTAAGGAGNNPFVHSTLFNSFFTPHSSLAGVTMFALVSSGGGSNPAQKAARNVVAAYLNSSFGIGFPYTPAEIATLWTNAVAGGNSALNALHTLLGAANNQDCPIRDPSAVTIVSGEEQAVAGASAGESLPADPSAEVSLQAGPSAEASLGSGIGTGGIASLDLYRPTPNPFVQSTRIAYAVSAGSGERVEMGVYDLSGRRVRGLVSGIMPVGRHEASWDGRNEDGALVRNGLYFVHTTIGSHRKIVTVVFLR